MRSNRLLLAFSIQHQSLSASSIPPPLLFKQSENGPISSDDEAGHFYDLPTRLMLDTLAPTTDFRQLPFDFSCPTVKSELHKKVCQSCGIYFSSAKALQVHKRRPPRGGCLGPETFYSEDTSVEIDDIEDEDEDYTQWEKMIFEDESISVPIISLKEFLTPLFCNEDELI